MILAYLLLFTGLTISAVAIYYSVVGLTAIFSAAAIPIMIMGVSLEVAKLVCATWIKQYWGQVPRLMKTYMVTAVVLLMIITSMGIFGFLSKAHNDQTLVSGDVGSKIAIYDEKIKTARENIEADRKQLSQMDAAVDQVMSRSSDEKGADKANAIRNSQKRDRAALARDIEANQRVIGQLNDEAAPIRAEVRKVEAEVGPIKYIAAFLYGTAPDASMLERAVTWIIIMIVVVFDPLAVIMLLASQMTFAWLRGERPQVKTKEDAKENVFTQFTEKIRKRIHKDDTPDFEGVRLPDGTWVQTGPAFKTPEPQEEYTDIDEVNRRLAEAREEPNTEVVHIADPEPEEKPPVVKRARWSGYSFPLASAFNKPKEEVVEEPAPDVVAVELPAPASVPEAAPGLNRGVMYSQPIQADNADVKLGKAANSDFGNQYPANPEKGDVYLRTDFLPNRLFKYNGNKWIEVDKDSTDVYAYNDMYIQHLIEEIKEGRYDADQLSDVEHDQIAEYLRKNA
jgi:hypothetical protein